MKPPVPDRGQLGRLLAGAVRLLQIDCRGVNHVVPLIGARNVRPGGPLHRQARCALRALISAWATVKSLELNCVWPNESLPRAEVCRLTVLR